ncbi:hypothetical protein CC117_10805 [Parafrankia colletiae]|uniref:Gram-positive cocci surface proteins LPxTG domain-containing protein n=1 Tax=Parafrankia colletiae TaxID=573497 RepID=A0A1S1RDI1_9ACTN|nr:hypothetical protein [Parafrankia colletiae]MCK9898498.1 hypothetical protein [Frankia sp. Cpl3]OHV44137.1 hypothetical protein CC117_10805 [Parafrankia colletiae]
MKFRTLGVALVAGGGLALAALPASPAAAFNDKHHDKHVPYPPVGCYGASGEGSVTKSLLLLGEATVFGGCGFLPGSTVKIQLGGVGQGIVKADGAGRFSAPVVPTTVGIQTLVATGVAGAPGTTSTAQDAGLPEEGDWFADKTGEEGGLFDDKVADEAVPVVPEVPVGDAIVADPSLPAVGGPAVDVPAVEAPVTDVPATGALPADGATNPAPEVPGRLASAITQDQGLIGSRVVTATITVIGIGQGGITGLPIDPGLIASWIGNWGHWADKHDKDQDGRDGSCFGDGFDRDKDNFDKDKDRVDKDKDRVDKDKDRVDTVKDDKFGEQQGLAAPVPTALADGDDRFDDKDDKDDLFGDKDRDKDRDRDGDCIIAGGVVGVGVGGAGVGGAGVGGAGAGAGAGALPFTGVETGAMASIAIALLGGGVLLRVAARRRRLAGRAQG